MGKHRHTGGSGVGSRLVPSLIAAGLIVVAAFGIGLIAGVVLPEPSHRVAARVTGTSEPAAPTTDATEVEVPTVPSTLEPTSAGATTGPSATGPSTTPTTSASARDSAAPSAVTSPATPAAPAPTSASLTPVAGHGKHHGRPWPKPTRR